MSSWEHTSPFVISFFLLLFPFSFSFFFFFYYFGYSVKRWEIMSVWFFFFPLWVTLLLFFFTGSLGLKSDYWSAGYGGSPCKKEIYVFFILEHQLCRGFQFPVLNNRGKPPCFFIHFSHLRAQTFSALALYIPRRSNTSSGPVFISRIFTDFCGVCLFFLWFADF